MARPKKIEATSEQVEAEGDVMPEAFIEILCALLANPNYYPKTDYVGVVNRARDIYNDVIKEFT